MGKKGVRNFNWLNLRFVYLLTFGILLVCSKPESTLERNIKNLKSEDSVARKKAAKALGELRDPKAVDPLIDALKDVDYDVRKTAIIALGKIGNHKAIKPLVDRLGDEDGIANAALNALINIGSSSVEPLLSLLQTGTSRQKVIAAKGLGAIGGRRATDGLIAGLKDSDPNVRKAVILALAKINTAQAIEAIANMMNDENSDVANTAAQALRGSGNEGLRQVRRLLRARGF
ncbi:MAG: HEAT repeat domain-containing protein [candidate division WOR-3 bacterium]